MTLYDTLSDALEAATAMGFSHVEIIDEMSPCTRYVIWQRMVSGYNEIEVWGHIGESEKFEEEPFGILSARCKSGDNPEDLIV